MDSTASKQLMSLIQRIERLEAEKAELVADIKAVKSEAKAMGYDVRTINEIIKLRKLDPADREEREYLLDIYKAALGMLADTPLGASAIQRASTPGKKGSQILPSDEEILGDVARFLHEAPQRVSHELKKAGLSIAAVDGTPCSTMFDANGSVIEYVRV